MCSTCVRVCYGIEVILRKTLENIEQWSSFVKSLVSFLTSLVQKITGTGIIPWRKTDTGIKVQRTDTAIKHQRRTDTGITVQRRTDTGITVQRRTSTGIQGTFRTLSLFYCLKQSLLRPLWFEAHQKGSTYMYVYLLQRQKVSYVTSERTNV